MKHTIPILITATATYLLSSCTVTLYSGRTTPPVLDLPKDRTAFVFVNSFDYTTPEYIKDRQEITYSHAVRGFTSGLKSVFESVVYEILENRRESERIKQDFRK